MIGLSVSELILNWKAQGREGTDVSVCLHLGGWKEIPSGGHLAPQSSLGLSLGASKRLFWSPELPSPCSLVLIHG